MRLGALAILLRLQPADGSGMGMPSATLADWTEETGPTCPFNCLRLKGGPTQIDQIGNCGCTCTTGIEAAKDGTIYSEVYINRDGYYAGCGFISDPKIMCGCARECNNLNIPESEVMASGSCPAYKGVEYVQTCDANFRSATLAEGGESTLSAAMDTLASLLGSTSGGASLSTSDADAVAGVVTTLTTHRTTLKVKEALITKALDLIDTYEAGAHGPLFMKASHPGPFKRLQQGADDKHVLDRAMLLLQQVCPALKGYACLLSCVLLAHMR